MKRNPQRTQNIAFFFLFISTLLIVVPVGMIVAIIVQKGLPAINWQFLTDVPRQGMRAGGIFPAIVGTIYLVSGAIDMQISTGTNVDVNAADKFILDGAISDMGSGDSVMVLVDFGDGKLQKSMVKNGLFSFSHFYQRQGAYNVHVRAFDDDSGMTDVSFVVNVQSESNYEYLTEEGDEVVTQTLTNQSVSSSSDKSSSSLFQMNGGGGPPR